MHFLDAVDDDIDDGIGIVRHIQATMPIDEQERPKRFLKALGDGDGRAEELLGTALTWQLGEVTAWDVFGVS
jgi:hypothetical protein